MGESKKIYPNLLSVTEESWENQIKAAEEDLAIVNLKKSETIGHK